MAESILVVLSLLSLGCVWIAFRRAQGITALFWFLFAVVLAVLLVPTAFQAYGTIFDKNILSDSTWRLLFCLYGAPILMMLFLPETHRHSRVKSEIFLDLFQVGIVVALIYSTFFFLPAGRMLPADALLRNLSISNVQSFLLLVAALVRLHFARVANTRGLLLRLGLFLTVCAVVTLIGDWIDLHHFVSAAAWFDLGWAIPNFAAGMLALTWTPAPELHSPEPANFLSFLGRNLSLVAVLVCTNLMMDRWKQAHGGILADAAIAASLFAFTLRLALTQFHQQQEIEQRRVAQNQLAVSHKEVGRLLADARRQTAEITEISELGSLLQACTSQAEVFRLIPERLRRLFPGASGCIALLNPAKNRVQSVAKWGICPADQLFVPEECWALRRGRIHAHSGGSSDPRCPHLLGEGPSVCIPLIANGDVIGTISIQDDDPPHPVPDPEVDANAFARLAFGGRCRRTHCCFDCES